MNHTLNFQKIHIEHSSTNLWPDLSKLNPFKSINSNKIIIILVLIMAIIIIIIKCVKCHKCGKKKESATIKNLTELSKKYKSTPQMKRKDTSNKAAEKWKTSKRDPKQNTNRQGSKAKAPNRSDRKISS